MISISDAITLAAGDAQVEIAPSIGGSIARFSWRGVDVLRPTAADSRAERNVRGYACYPLVPYSNRIANARFAFEGREHALERNFGEHPHSIHGTGWQREWQASVVEPDNALLSLCYEPEVPAVDQVPEKAIAWPWPFHATQSFALAAHEGGALLTMKLSVENTGDTAFPFGLGWHPFFLRTADTELGLVAEGVWLTDATQLPTRHTPIPAGWCFDPPRPPGEGAIDNVFTGWDGRATLRDPGRGISVDVSADRACAFLVVYVPSGRDFLAVEPVTHMTDSFNRAARGEPDTGTRTLRSGAAFSVTMRIFVRPLT